MENTKISLRLRIMLTFIALALYVSAQGDGNSYRLIELKAEHLPSLNIARTGHETLCLDGELTVFGGHTDGFIPTATAEYLHDGAWQTLPLDYPHDQGVAIRLRSGKVFLAGGHKEPLGIGQLFSAELYDPTSHICHGFGCMGKKRAFANGIEMADGQVLIAGNWYADDGIEMFSNVADPRCTNAVEVKETSFARAKPYILRISDDDAIVFSSLDNKAKPVDYGIVDRLKGSAYREPFLDTWHPIHTIQVRRSLNHFIGNEAEGRYEWLLPVENDETHEVAIARVKGPAHDGANATFSLLPTEQPLPDSINGKHIIYSSLVCDRERGLAYLVGDDNDEGLMIVVCIRYDTTAPSPVTIYDAGSQPIKAASVTPVLTPDGDLVFAGGYLHSNFSPSSSVILLPLGHAGDIAVNDSAVKGGSGGRAWWLWIVMPCLLACAVGAVLLVKRRKPEAQQPSADEPATAESAEDMPLDDNLPKEEALADLIKRIDQLMEDEQLYLNADLRVSDVAGRVGSNTTYVSEAINSQRGCTFSQFLTAYRIAYAQKLMRQSPERKISDISALSGFSTESTFFRAFRTSTGMSPKEWLAAARDNLISQEKFF